MFRIRRNRFLIYLGLAFGLVVSSLWMPWEKGREAEAQCVDIPTGRGPYNDIYQCPGQGDCEFDRDDIFLPQCEGQMQFKDYCYQLNKVEDVNRRCSSWVNGVPNAAAVKVDCAVTLDVVAFYPD